MGGRDAFLLLPVASYARSKLSWTIGKATRVDDVVFTLVEGPTVDPNAARVVAVAVARNYGIASGDVDVRVRAGAGRGDYVTVEVRVRMPAVAVAGVLQAGAWTYTATQQRRLDDYRSR
jgi:hypothetical protein